VRGGRAGGCAGAGDLLNADLELALTAAHDAGALLLERFGGPALDVDVKSSATDMVSAADRDAEELLRGMLMRERPEDGLVGEEGSREEARSERRWVVDPIDGTTNFLYGFPVWSVSVALEDGSGGLVGVVYDPVRDETFAAARGGGATLNGAALRMDPGGTLETALVATGFGYDAERRAKQSEVLARVLPRVRDIRRAGAASLDLCWLAAGRVDAYWERGLQHWDWAAARLIVTEAGGAVADLEPEPHGLAAAGVELLPALRDLLGQAERGVFT
jgi:myo-inositol-1(or 4)-monophosphatase